MTGKSSDKNTLNNFDRMLLNDFQHGFPLTSRPYGELADSTGFDETTVIERLQSLAQDGYISRIGPVFRCNTLGVSTLAAMSVPEHEVEKTAAIINRYPGVNHNYERDHEYNLWFVIAAESQTQLDEQLGKIEQETGYACLSLPMLEDFHIDLGFALRWA